MKAARTTVRIFLLAAAAAAMMLALGGCPNPVADLLKAGAWGLLGEWESTETDGGAPGWFWRLTVRADGTFRAHDLGGGMSSEGTYVVDDVWVSGDSRTLKVHYTYSGGTSHHRVLIRVTDGTSYESNYSNMNEYPAAIDSGVAGYLTATRQ